MLTCESRPFSCTLAARPLFGGHGHHEWPQNPRISGADLLCTFFGTLAFECGRKSRQARHDSSLQRQPKA
jgi:hypothetical protein